MSDLTSPEIARPDDDSARMVQESIARLAGREMELTEGFYNHLFAMLPEVRVLFPEDMAEQRVRLLKALLASVDSLHDPEGMEAQLQALGEIHYYRGIADDQYQYVGHALIRTVRDIVPGDWSTWLSSAWISVYSWMTQHMVFGAKRAREHVESGVSDAYPSPYPAQAHQAPAYEVQERPPPGSQGQDHQGQDHQPSTPAGTWVRYPQLAELGQEPITAPAAVQPRPDLLVPQAGPPSQDQRTLAGTTPDAGNRSSWFGATAGAEAVVTVFPRRRRGAGLG
jgi:hemoglobin-like flavoprotein